MSKIKQNLYPHGAWILVRNRFSPGSSDKGAWGKAEALILYYGPGGVKEKRSKTDKDEQLIHGGASVTWPGSYEERQPVFGPLRMSPDRLYRNMPWSGQEKEAGDKNYTAASSIESLPSGGVNFSHPWVFLGPFSSQGEDRFHKLSRGPFPEFRVAEEPKVTLVVAAGKRKAKRIWDDP